MTWELLTVKLNIFTLMFGYFSNDCNDLVAWREYFRLILYISNWLDVSSGVKSIKLTYFHLHLVLVCSIVAFKSECHQDGNKENVHGTLLFICYAWIVLTAFDFNAEFWSSNSFIDEISLLYSVSEFKSCKKLSRTQRVLHNTWNVTFAWCFE